MGSAGMWMFFICHDTDRMMLASFVLLATLLNECGSTRVANVQKPTKFPLVRATRPLPVSHRSFTLAHCPPVIACTAAIAAATFSAFSFLRSFF